jgi:hypothetical protein
MKKSHNFNYGSQNPARLPARLSFDIFNQPLI